MCVREALKGYFKAGVLHGRLSPETIMIFEAADKDARTYGVVLDLDGPKCTRFVPGEGVDTSGYRWAVRDAGAGAGGAVADDLKLGGEVSVL